jgi:hypothetical protein
VWGWLIITYCLICMMCEGANYMSFKHKNRKRRQFGPSTP